jgi:DNA-binding HxlR family transcriptional regulator
MDNFDYINGVCPVGITVNMVGGKWKIAILWQLREGTLRFNELHKALNGMVSQAVLTNQLRELEADELIHREVYKEVPPRVEYSLTELGKSFLPIIVQMGRWGQTFLNNNCN